MSDPKKEREFLHAIASPLAGIEMILESVMEDLAETKDELGCNERVKDALNGLERMKQLLQKRREEVLNDK